jgi:hypothetical protein
MAFLFEQIRGQAIEHWAGTRPISRLVPLSFDVHIGRMQNAGASGRRFGFNMTPLMLLPGSTDGAAAHGPPDAGAVTLAVWALLPPGAPRRSLVRSMSRVAGKGRADTSHFVKQFSRARMNRFPT